MYQIIHTIYQTDQIVIHQARNGNIPMVSLSVNRRLDLMPLAQCGGLCLRVTKELGAKLEVTNQKIVLIEDVKFSDNRTELYFIGELFHLNNQDLIEGRKTESVRRILIELYKAYNSLLKQNKQLDFSLYNLFQIQDQLKVLDMGILNRKVQKDSSPTNQLALLIIKLFLSRQQFKPLKYMNCDQQIEYIRNFNEFLILLPMLEDINKRISWENLGCYLISDVNNKQEVPSVAVYYKQPYKLNQTLNSYSLAVQRMQSNVRSRSKRHLGSLYEHQKTSINGQEDDSQENQRVIRSRRTIHPNINLIKPGSMQSTPNHNKMEHPYRHSPIILNTQSQTQQIRSQFKTENSLQTIPQNISYDNFFLQTQTMTPEDSQSKFVSINANVSQNYYSQENQISYENEQLNTLQQLQEKSTIQHEKRIFKLPQHKQLPPKDNESTIKVIKFEEDLIKEFDQYSEKYKQYIECLNMIGKTVAKCINILDANNNLWMMPLFIVFKRMYQLRLLFQDGIQNNHNIFQLQHFLEFTENQKYQQFKDEFISQNNIVKNEVQTLLQNCEFKIDKLDKKNQQKITPLLNLNCDQSIRDISFIYFYQQIYSYIKKLMVERPKQAQSLRDLIVKIQCSLLIMDQSIGDFKFDLKEYNNRRQDELYRQENDQKLEKIKMRIQKNGYQF